ncbi:unannotated protein [freshwater metagenome]|uniref:Unannotated protein n=1 Tax=freshwater metagenome TaxID=449393 RepID=A0A6J5ZGL9_9ZZZZ
MSVIVASFIVIVVAGVRSTPDYRYSSRLVLARPNLRIRS